MKNILLAIDIILLIAWAVYGATVFGFKGSDTKASVFWNLVLLFAIYMFCDT